MWRWTRIASCTDILGSSLILPEILLPTRVTVLQDINWQHILQSYFWQLLFNFWPFISILSFPNSWFWWDWEWWAVPSSRLVKFNREEVFLDYLDIPDFWDLTLTLNNALINIYFATGVFPLVLKVSKVVPVFNPILNGRKTYAKNFKFSPK